MAVSMVFARREYAEPLALVQTIETDAPPALSDLDVGDDWLELVLVPQTAAIWVIRDARLAADRAGTAP
jgi:hypothetical protein